jgi:hypothetical protein
MLWRYFTGEVFASIGWTGRRWSRRACSDRDENAIRD